MGLAINIPIFFWYITHRSGKQIMSEVEEELVKECPTCGAAMAVSPEDLVITCEYCGETLDVEGKKIPDHQMLPSQEKSTIEENVIQFLRKNKVKEGTNLSEIKAVYIPYWGVKYQSDTSYYGVQQGTVQRQKQETYTDSEGNTRTRTVTYNVTVYKPEEGNFHRSGRENVIARKHTAFYGFQKFQKTLYLENIEPFDFDKIKGYGAAFINAEVDAQESQRIAYSRVDDENRKIAASKVSKLVRCDSQIQTDYPIYVHAPLWQARYNFQGKVYKVSVAGDSGKVVKGEIPLTFMRRLINLIIGLSILFASAIFAQVGYGLVVAGEDAYWILIIICLVGAALSFMFTQTAFRMQLEKSEKIKKPKKKKKKKGGSS